MAYETYATLKRMVANRLGKTNDATAITLRDNAIIDACKQIYQDAQFPFLLKTASLSVTTGAANLPTDFIVSYGLKLVRKSGTSPISTDYYTPVSITEKDLYPTSDRIYWITYDATNKVFVFNTNQTTETVTIFYYFQPTDLSGSTDITPIPDPMAIVYLSVAMYWLAAERDEDEWDRFYKLYQSRLNQMVSDNKVNNPERRHLKSYIPDSNNFFDTSSTRR